MTNTGPLTTIFTPAPECSSIVSGTSFKQILDDGYTTIYKYLSLGPNTTSKCYPRGFADPFDYYSPGICPFGWTLACMFIDYAASLTETTAKCCPRGYTCQSTGVTRGWSTLSCFSTAIPDISATVPNLSNQYTVTVITNAVLHAAAVNVRWQRDDHMPPETLTLTSASKSTTLNTSSQNASVSLTIPTASNVSVINNTVQSMSVNVKIGIGVGVGILAVICFAVGGLMWLKWRNKARERNRISPVVQDGSPEVTKTPLAMWVQYQQEMPTSSNTHEMATEHNRHEVGGDSRPAELP
ncbi:hypothetical protein F5Y13DRAFT_195924 [Hypoxylon sp. FL1857]|nr:hypothetical protein F5Y13DRAFT_195924 [Hypoxylon sp. FL1857]